MSNVIELKYLIKRRKKRKDCDFNAYELLVALALHDKSLNKKDCSIDIEDISNKTICSTTSKISTRFKSRKDKIHTYIKTLKNCIEDEDYFNNPIKKFI